MYESIALLAAFALVYSSLAGGVERTWVSGPILFMLFGLAVGPAGLGLLGVGIEGEALKALAEVTLALVLFTDASNSDLGVLRRWEELPVRLLLVGLPLTIVLGHFVGIALFDHPTNLRYPTYWHVRDYGLMTANPFGLSFFEGEGHDGSHVLPAGQNLTFRYRVLVHAGGAREGDVRDKYLEWLFPPTATVVT